MGRETPAKLRWYRDLNRPLEKLALCEGFCRGLFRVEQGGEKYGFAEKAWDAEALLAIQKTAFAPLLEKYRDYATNPAMESLSAIEGKLGKRDYYFILLDGQEVGLAGVRRRIPCA